jgi:hypothetical protein
MAKANAKSVALLPFLIVKFESVLNVGVLLI